VCISKAPYNSLVGIPSIYIYPCYEADLSYPHFLQSVSSNNGAQQRLCFPRIPCPERYKFPTYAISIYIKLNHAGIHTYTIFSFYFVLTAGPMVLNPVGEVDRIINKMRKEYKTYIDIVNLDVEYVSCLCNIDVQWLSTFLLSY